MDIIPQPIANHVAGTLHPDRAGKLTVANLLGRRVAFGLIVAATQTRRAIRIISSGINVPESPLAVDRVR